MVRGILCAAERISQDANTAELRMGSAGGGLALGETGELAEEPLTRALKDIGWNVMSVAKEAF